MYGGLGAMLFFLLVLFLQQVAGLQRAGGRRSSLPVDPRDVRASPPASARSPTGSGRASSWAWARWSRPPGTRPDPARRRGRGLPHRPAARAARLRARPVDAPSRRSPPRCCPTPTSHNAGIASGVNNAIARVAGLIAVAAIGAVISAQFGSSLDQQLGKLTLSTAARAAVAQASGQTLTRVEPGSAGPEVAGAVASASVHAFHVGIGISAALVAAGGLLGLAGIRNPRRVVRCEDCAGGQLAGQPLDTARPRGPVISPPQPIPAQARARA